MRKNWDKLTRICGVTISVSIAIFVIVFIKNGDNILQECRERLITGSVKAVVEKMIPQIQFYTAEGGKISWGQKLSEWAIPFLAYGRENTEDYEKLALQENQQWEMLMQENAQAAQQQEEESMTSEIYIENEQTVVDLSAPPVVTGPVQEADDGKTADSTEAVVSQNSNAGVLHLTEKVKQVEINRGKLSDYDYLLQNFYQVDNTTTIRKDQLNVTKLLTPDLTLPKEDSDQPQILIYHTHSHEDYADSKEGEAGDTVVGVGEYLTQILTEKYGYRVLHHTGTYDDDRDRAYSKAAPALEAILEENPQIQLVIDLHRDSVPEDMHMVTEIGGKQTAKIMFFNGLCRTTALGELTNLPNPYLEENLALSFQMQLAAAEFYPGFTRRIYLKGYRYNMHLCPYSMLVEVGAQNNTVSEAKNAMEPLAALLDYVLSGESREQ